MYFYTPLQFSVLLTELRVKKLPLIDVRDCKSETYLQFAIDLRRIKQFNKYHIISGLTSDNWTAPEGYFYLIEIKPAAKSNSVPEDNSQTAEIGNQIVVKQEVAKYTGDNGVKYRKRSLRQKKAETALYNRYIGEENTAHIQQLDKQYNDYPETNLQYYPEQYDNPALKKDESVVAPKYMTEEETRNNIAYLYYQKQGLYYQIRELRSDLLGKGKAKVQLLKRKIGQLEAKMRCVERELLDLSATLPQ